MTPPASMRNAVMQRISEVPQEAVPSQPVADATPLPVRPPAPGGEPETASGTRDPDVIPIRRVRWAAIVTAAVGIAAVFIAVVLVLGGDATGDVMAAPDARVIQVEAPPGTKASLTFSADRMQAVFTAEDLAAPGADRTYQLWVIAGDAPTPAGTFVPDENGAVQVLLEESVETGQVIGLTIEPAGGSPAPTGDVLLAQPIT